MSKQEVKQNGDVASRILRLGCTERKKLLASLQRVSSRVLASISKLALD